MKKTKTSEASATQKQEAKAAFDWKQVQNTGFENVQQDDLGLPFLAICQSNSPEVNKSNPQHPEKKIPGIVVGDIFNNLSRQILYRSEGDSPLVFIPCAFTKAYVEWRQRESGGGMVRMHFDSQILNETTKNDRGQDVLKNGNLIATTAYFNGLAIIDDGPIQCLIGMTSTQLKKSRTWLTRMMAIKWKDNGGQMYTPPMFAHKYHITTQPESNNEGSWMGWKIDQGEANSDPALIQECVATSKRSISVTRQQALPAPAPAPEHY